MTISEIAHRTDHDRKTIRSHLAGDRALELRRWLEPDPFEKFVDRLTTRLTEDPHLWVVTIVVELAPLGFNGSFSDPDPTGSRPQAADGLHRVLACTETAEHVHRAPSRGGDPVRLG